MNKKLLSVVIPVSVVKKLRYFYKAYNTRTQFYKIATAIIEDEKEEGSYIREFTVLKLFL